MDDPAPAGSSASASAQALEAEIDAAISICGGDVRAALRAGDVWLETSRRYANPASYLIPPVRWPALRPEVCTLTQTPEDGAARVKERQTETRSAPAPL